MKTDPLQAAADATAGYLLELARKGTSIVTWANLHDFFLSRSIKEREHAVAMVLANRGYLSPRPWVPRRDSLGRELPILNIFRNSEPSSWTILPAIFGTVANDQILSHPILEAAKELRLKGNQLRAIEMMVESDCKATIAEYEDEFGWTSPIEDWKSLRKSLDKKLRKRGWNIYTFDKRPHFRPVPAKSEGIKEG